MTAFNKNDLYSEKPNHFGYSGLDRAILFRDDKNWLNKLKKMKMCVLN